MNKAGNWVLGLVYVYVVYVYVAFMVCYFGTPLLTKALPELSNLHVKALSLVIGVHAAFLGCWAIEVTTKKR